MLSLIRSIKATYAFVMISLGGPLSLSATPQGEQDTSILQISSQGSAHPSHQELPTEYSVLLEHLTQIQNSQDSHDLVGGSVLITLGSALAIGGGYFTYQMTQTHDCVGEDGYCTASNLVMIFFGVPLGSILMGTGLLGANWGIKTFNDHPREEHTLTRLAQIKKDKGEEAALTYARYSLKISSNQSRSRRIRWGTGYTTLALGLYGFSYLYWEILDTSSKVSLVGGVSMSILALFTFFMESEAERHLNEYQREGQRRRGLTDQSWSVRPKSTLAQHTIQMLPLVDHDRLGFSVQGRF